MKFETLLQTDRDSFSVCVELWVLLLFVFSGAPIAPPSETTMSLRTADLSGWSITGIHLAFQAPIIRVPVAFYEPSITATSSLRGTTVSNNERSPCHHTSQLHVRYREMMNFAGEKE